MTKNTNRKATARKYRVLYAVTRAEYYEIESVSAQDAEDLAFTDGELVTNRGDTTNVEPLEVQKIEAFTKASRTNATNTPQNWYIHQCPETGRRFLCQTGHDNNIAELFGTPEQDSLIADAPALLAVAKLALDYLDGQEYLQASAIIARALNE